MLASADVAEEDPRLVEVHGALVHDVLEFVELGRLGGALGEQRVDGLWCVRGSGRVGVGQQSGRVGSGQQSCGDAAGWGGVGRGGAGEHKRKQRVYASRGLHRWRTLLSSSLPPRTYVIHKSATEAVSFLRASLHNCSAYL